MSANLAPMGLRPVGESGSGPVTGKITQYPLTTNNTVIIASGSPVALVSGSIVPVTATPTTTNNANTPIGVAIGFEYQNPDRGFMCADFLPANAISSALYTNIKVLVVDSPSALFELQADGTIAASAVGASIALTNFGADVGLPYRTSKVEADHTTVSHSSSTQAMKIVKISPVIGNLAGDTYTRIVARWNAGVHYFTNVGSE